MTITSQAPATPTDAELAQVALTRAEYDSAVEQLGRRPGEVELGILGALWSEHCSYKTSRPLLRGLPTSGARVLQGPGENAGAVDIGGGLACVFKIESHNHPSAIEPYQGAATGVGGILRDIFTMGARPVALLDSLRFGPIDEPRQRHLFDGVVAGIGGYGNCIGVPTVGGEVYFDASYRDNCVVNAMCAGVVEHGKLTRARASGPGNVVLLVGAGTGRDGIHGASFASVPLDSAGESRRPAVQVGNPFLEKCLMEACLELAGDPRVVAMQDLGAAGLCGSAAELAHRGGVGIDVDVSHVARRERGMSAYEVMLSESQERMLVVVRPDDVPAVQDVFARWDLHSDAVGTIIGAPELIVREGSRIVCELPLPVLVDGAPERSAPGPAPKRLTTLALRQWHSPWPPAETLLRLLASPNIGSRRPIFRTYDHQVGDATVVAPGGDAALVRVEGTRRGLALTTDGNARYTALNPRLGAAIAVCEAARNVVATGAKPIALTNCLNFGNPERNDVYWDLHDAIAGIADACAALDVPVVSGNVSLYNESESAGIAPTVVIGMVGVIDDVERRCRAGFAREGDRVALAGPLGGRLDASELQRLAFGANAKHAPDLDLELERRVQAFVRDAISDGLLASAHDCADGGLAVALSECCLWGDTGVRIALDVTTQDPRQGREARDGILFGETQSRFLISFAMEASVQLHELADRHAVPLQDIGVVGGDRIVIDDVLDVGLAEVKDAYEGALLDGQGSPPEIDDHFHEECGIFGVFHPGEDVANLTYFGLYSLQHRGQESAGIAVSDGERVRMRKEMGLVSQVFDQEDIEALRGHVAIGHTRYSTTGSPRLPNAQPMRFEHPTLGPIVLAHNGNLVNAHSLRDELIAGGAVFESTSDTEVLGALLTRTPGASLEQVLAQALPRLEGAYCLLFLTRDTLAAARDPLGIRPLCLGRFGDVDAPGGTGYVIASETCALDVIGAAFICEIEPGEIVSIDRTGMRSTKIPHQAAGRAMCSFEFIYFARPDSVMMGQSLYEARRKMGRELAREAPADGDIVITLPDSGTPAAIGFADQSGLPFAEGMIKSRYITRTFIQPTQRLRESGIRLKFNPMRHVLEGKRVVLVDDSIVRGTTSRRIIDELRRAGATEVHMRIASPPIAWPCFMGIDIASRRELIAADHSVSEIGALLGADTLEYLSLTGLRRAMGKPDGEGFCFACFTGTYPVTVPAHLEADKLALEIPVAAASS